MSIEAHVASLSQRHFSLEQQIHEEASRPMPDVLRLSELKKAKLKLKDEIGKLSHH